MNMKYLKTIQPSILNTQNDVYYGAIRMVLSSLSMAKLQSSLQHAYLGLGVDEPAEGLAALEHTDQGGVVQSKNK